MTSKPLVQMVQGTVRRLGNAEQQKKVVRDSEWDDFGEDWRPDQLSSIHNFINSGGSRSAPQYGQPPAEDSDDPFADIDNDSDVPRSRVSPPKSPSKTKVTFAQPDPRSQLSSSSSFALAPVSVPQGGAKPGGSGRGGFISMADFQANPQMAHGAPRPKGFIPAGGPAPTQFPGLRISHSLPKEAQVTRLGSTQRQAIQEEWDDFELPSHSPRYQTATQHEEILDWGDEEDRQSTTSKNSGRPPLAGPPMRRPGQWSPQDIEDDTTGLELNPAKPLLSKNTKRSVSQTNFSGDWEKKISGGKAGSAVSKHSGITPPASSNSSARSESDSEADPELQLQFPSNASTLHLRQEDDDSSGLEIPDDSFLNETRLPARRSSRSQTIQSFSSASLSRVNSLSGTGSISRGTSSRMSGDLARMRGQKPEQWSVQEEQELGVNANSRFNRISKVQSDGTELDALDQTSRPSAKSNVRSIRAHDSLLGKKVVISTEDFGDGTELDAIENLAVPSPQQQQQQVPRKRLRRPVVLIRNLNKNPERNVIGKMTYDPKKQIWEGNEEALKPFDPNYMPRAPALIKKLGGKNQGFVGKMVLDQNTMRWVGNDEEPDVFDDIPDLDDRSREPLHFTSFSSDRFDLCRLSFLFFSFLFSFFSQG